MANPEHLVKIKEGVQAWNTWRKENPFERPDLSGADLREAVLRWADLRWADLRDVDLRRADLRGVRNLTVDQLCQAKTLYKAIMESTLEAEVRQKCPELFNEPE